MFVRDMEQVNALDTQNKPALLQAMMSALASQRSVISFEGSLANTELAKLSHATFEETSTLKRGTLWPKLDFLVLPLTNKTLSAIEKAIFSKAAFGNKGIVHVQIEKDGVLAFAAFDGFHR